MEILSVRGSVFVAFKEGGRVYTLIITPLLGGYINWRVSLADGTMYAREGLHVPQFRFFTEDLIREALLFLSNNAMGNDNGRDQ